MTKEDGLLVETRKRIAAIPGVVEVGNFERHGRTAVALPLTLLAPPGGQLPARTRWYLVARNGEGTGSLDLHPAVEGGLVSTHPHQAWNGPKEDRPWTAGAICPRAFRQARRRLLPDEEPPGFPERGPWLLRAGLRWLEAASEGSLTRDGEPFELPPQPAETGPTVAWSEGPEELGYWLERIGRVGLVGLTEVRRGELLVVNRFRDRHGVAERSLCWGTTLQALGEATGPTGAWVMLPSLPVSAPWHLPQTWGELLTLVNPHVIGGDLVRSLSGLTIPDGRRTPVLLLGTPVPRRFGEGPHQVHWYAVEIPTVAGSGNPPRGFRHAAAGRRCFDRNIRFKESRRITWHSSRNWHPAQLAARGISAPLAGRRALLIGAGALGSQVSELLVRAGLRRIDILDPDRLEAGNLVRHTGLVLNVGLHKAADLANRLNFATPHTRATGHNETYPPVSTEAREALRLADLVLDLSADNDVLRELERRRSPQDRLYVSAFIARNGQRAYAYVTEGPHLPATEAEAAWGPLLAEDTRCCPPSDQPWEGVGCWSPVFPASAPDVAAAAAFVANTVIDALESGARGLRVYTGSRTELHGAPAR